MTIRGRGSVMIEGVTAQEVFDFVLDPAQYRKADTKVLDVTKLASTRDGMLAREDGLFLGRFRGSIITQYRWQPPERIDVTVVHGIPESLHAWFNIDETECGTRLEHVEEMTMGHGPFGVVYDWIARAWFEAAVEQEVAEIARLMRAGERGRGIGAHDAS
jgi:polyketide cyclase/dehydrase/lipid transport protein